MYTQVYPFAWWGHNCYYVLWITNSFCMIFSIIYICMFISLKTVQRISIKIDNKSLKGSFKCVSVHSLRLGAH